MISIVLTQFHLINFTQKSLVKRNSNLQQSLALYLNSLNQHLWKQFRSIAKIIFNMIGELNDRKTKRAKSDFERKIDQRVFEYQIIFYCVIGSS
ncbi:unnamed protein product [Paramecium sonneborni]|uniref:Uncharacterized protein n=1 Tax=Paramecium sonneborni TaxID=65129 RepID=A0A8S1M7I5_9CILI|nr:unnamed protein product [Paramecium sonneborni]